MVESEMCRKEGRRLKNQMCPPETRRVRMTSRVLAPETDIYSSTNLDSDAHHG